MAVRQSRGRWTVEFQQAGSRVFRRLPQGCTKAQAQELETKLRRELFDAGPLGHREAITLPAAIQAWLRDNHRKNQKQALSEAAQWADYVAGKLLQEAPETAQEAVRAWRKAGTLPSTINRRLCVLKAAGKHAWKQGWIAENVSGRITLLPERNAREVYLSRAELARLAKAAPTPECRSAIILLAYTGLRTAEMLALPAQARGVTTLSVKVSKSGKPRIVPVAGPARPHLRALPIGLTYWQLHAQFDAARKAAGLEHVRPHDLRHTCASLLINRGVDLYVVGKILGHAGPQTTARYAHLADRTLRKAMAKLR